MNKKQKVIEAIEKIKHKLKSVLSHNLNSLNIFFLDLSDNNSELNDMVIQNTEYFTDYIFGKMKKYHTPVLLGRYNENRTIYSRSGLFKGEKSPRTIHLGIDLWTKAGESVFSPLTGKVHSFKNNDTFGNYGPTIILEHNIDYTTFYTLYGHLSLDSIRRLETGKEFESGEEIARIGNFPINGDWPPHLHFQIITDMKGNKGDFPGVCSLEERNHYLEICPDPNLILNIKSLK